MPVMEDWRTCSREDFFKRISTSAVVLKGLGSDSRAYREWDNEFFRKHWKAPVTVTCENRIGSTSNLATMKMQLDQFISLVNGPEPVYLSFWYFFRENPHLIDQLTSTFPDYLLDDWMGIIPNGWGFSPGTRNNLFWGSNGTCTRCHYDDLNTITWNTTLRGNKRWLLFSARGFDSYQPNGDWTRLMHEHGVMTDGFVTAEGLRRYFAEKPSQLPELDFYYAEVPAGSTVFVPWQWAHQVHNQGECLAYSRYYVSADNYDACHEFLKRNFGPVAGALFRGVIGSSRSRSILRNPSIRAVLESAPVCKAFQLGLHLAGIRPPPIHYLIPDAKVPAGKANSDP